VQVTAGWAQDADTLVNVPAPPADTYPAQFSLAWAAALTPAPGSAWPGSAWPGADGPVAGPPGPGIIM
jgi:hypothetical protein